MVQGGFLPNRENGKLTEKVDVMAIGFLVLSLITKTVFAKEGKSSVPSVHELIWSKYESEESKGGIEDYNCLVVHKSLSAEPDYYLDDGYTIVKLVMKCIRRHEDKRLTMKQVVKHLLKLEVVKHHAHFLGVETAVAPQVEHGGSCN
ncbi:hypothetical protein ACH5RR_028746 [Cinchona calisaya]|uniref:Uncharacterized protein n=1 Tax=Cinchona calisaya TaxID=153742 RepID=A0ABD2YPN3_9GENT